MKIIMNLASPHRSLSVAISDDASVVSVGIVGKAVDFAPGKVIPPGYWEFAGEQAEMLAMSAAGWDALEVMTLVWYWQFSGTLPVDLDGGEHQPLTVPTYAPSAKEGQ